MAELEQQKVEVETRLGDAPVDLPDVNPNAAEIYRRKVTRLAEALADSQASQKAAAAIRSLIGDVVLTQGERRGKVNATMRRTAGNPRFGEWCEHSKNCRVRSYNKRGREPPL